ncbi:MAG: ABC transporter permease [Nitrososphaerales archaeon]|nr:ABC transporter permease [Nitrososphaerales archaeon]
MSSQRASRFSFRRSTAVAVRVLTQIRRDRRTLAMLMVMPAVIMLIFGFALGGQASNVPILVDNQDAGYSATLGPTNINLHAGSQVLTSMQANGVVKVTVGSFADGKDGVDSGKYFASILIPANFSRSLFLKSSGATVTPSLQVYLDGTKPALTAGILGALQGSVQNASGVKGFDVVRQYAFGGVQFSGLDVSLPSVIAFVLTFLVLLVSLLTISRETTSGTLPRLFTTPLTALERLLGYAFALLLLGVMMVTVILVIGVGLFGVVVRGSLVLLFSAAVLYALAHVLMAVFLSNFAKNELQAVQLAPLIALPSMALSGMLVPVNSLPDWIQPLARVVPLYYGNRLFEGIMLKGYGVGQLATDFLVVGGIAVLFLILALSTVKDRIDA